MRVRQTRPKTHESRADLPPLTPAPAREADKRPEGACRQAEAAGAERPKGATMKRSKSADPAHDVLGYERQQLDAIFRPETVAVIGASERPGSVGRTIMWNLVSSPFGGTIFPVNSHRPNVLGIKAYPSVSEVPALVGLPVIEAPGQALRWFIGEGAGGWL